MPASVTFSTIPEAMFHMGTGINYPTVYNNSSRFEAHVLTRILYTAALPTFLIKQAIETIQATAHLAGAFFLSVNFLNEYHEKEIVNRVFQNEAHLTFSHLLTRPYACILKILNPWAEVPAYITDEVATSSLAFPTHASILLFGSDSKNPLMRHVVARASIPFILIARTIQHLFCLAIGGLFAALSICSLGKIRLINRVAFAGLESTVVVKEIILYTLLFINPQAAITQDVYRSKIWKFTDIINLKPPYRSEYVYDNDDINN